MNFLLPIASCLMPMASLDDLIRSCQHVRWNREADLLGSFQIDDELEFFGLLHGEVGGLGAFQNLVYVVSCLAVQLIVVDPIRHETALFHKLLLKIHSWQSVFAGQLDDSLSLGKKTRRSRRHYRASLFLLSSLKSAI